MLPILVKDSFPRSIIRAHDEFHIRVFGANDCLVFVDEGTKVGHAG